MAKTPGKKPSAALKKVKTPRKPKAAAKRTLRKRGSPAAPALRKPAMPSFMRLAGVDEAPSAAIEPRPIAPVAIAHEHIARRAYEIWEAKLRLANDAARNWLEAEAELRANPPSA